MFGVANFCHVGTNRAERIRSTVDVAGAEVDLRDMGELVVTLKGGDCVQLRTLVGQRQAEEASRWSQKLLLASNEVDDRARATAAILRSAEANADEMEAPPPPSSPPPSSRRTVRT